jgi:hypothetical protein
MTDNGRPYTWAELNRRLRELRSEAMVLELFEAQKRSGANGRWLRRIHARYRYLRMKREKKELARRA